VFPIIAPNWQSGNRKMVWHWRLSLQRQILRQYTPIHSEIYGQFIVFSTKVFRAGIRFHFILKAWLIILLASVTLQPGTVADDDGGQHERRDAAGDELVRLFARAFFKSQNLLLLCQI
jgi:hypothetical protein